MQASNFSNGSLGTLIRTTQRSTVMPNRLRDTLALLKVSQPNLEWLVLAALCAAVWNVGVNIKMHQLKNSMPDGTSDNGDAIEVFADPYFYGPFEIL